jgi:hypothetical protein
MSEKRLRVPHLDLVKPRPRRLKTDSGIGHRFTAG